MQGKNIAQPDTFDDETKQDIDRMASLSGSEFDREFINMMVTDHQRTLELFRSVSLTAHDTDVQDYVDGMIPKLDKHLRKAQELQSKLFSGRGTPELVSVAPLCGAGPVWDAGVVAVGSGLGCGAGAGRSGFGLVQAVVGLVCVCCPSRELSCNSRTFHSSSSHGL